MLIYAGIDESGYGPLLGPLVISRSVFKIKGVESYPSLPCLWKILHKAVCRKISDSEERIPVNDSKYLYNPSRGIHQLERSVLSFFLLMNLNPKNLKQLLELVGCDELSKKTEHLDWYFDSNGGPFIPVKCNLSEIKKSNHLLKQEFTNNKAFLEEMQSFVVLEDRFNQFVKSLGKKSECLWFFIAKHLVAIWENYGEFNTHVVVDRLGGRKSYGDMLTKIFPQAWIDVEEETPLLSRYRVHHGRRQLKVYIEVRSENQHLPCALSSMVSKYIRELFMIRFQKFWLIHAPDVKPTYGYYTDGKRFLNEVDFLIKKLNIDIFKLIRCR